MATTETAICNSAIAKIGGALITSLDEATPRGRLFKEQYPKIRDELLYSHPWKFAMKTAVLAEVENDTVNFYAHKYALPADCLRVFETDERTDEWTVEGGFLLAQRANLAIRYISRMEDVSKYSPGFTELLSAKLAADCSYSLVQSVTLKNQLTQEFENKLRMTRSYSAQEGSTVRVYADSWLHSRY